MNKAFFVIGPESSGTRLVTKIFLHMGCYGDDGHNQRLDSMLFPEDRDIVLRRSIPHRGVFPDINRIYDMMCKTHDTSVIITMRSLYPMIRSQINASHVVDINHAKRNITHALYDISRFIYFINPPFIMITYEDLVFHSDQVIQTLSDFADLPVLDEVEAITDENLKYYTDN